MVDILVSGRYYEVENGGVTNFASKVIVTQLLIGHTMLFQLHMLKLARRAVKS